MEQLIKELKIARKAIERALEAAADLPVAQRTVKDLKEAQSLLESVIRRNKANTHKGK